MKVMGNSKFLYYLGFFLFFIISTHCYLVPNDPVVTDDPEDFDLIEGISYNIIHSITDMNLVCIRDSVQVGASDDSNSYQHWSLRKVKNNIYNIVNIGSGTNLDNNGKGAYVSIIEQNTINNQYQHWKFIKIKNNTYNIANVKNESQSLESIDSNGKKVYISPFNKNNIYQQWLFEPINYKLTTKVINFDLKFDKDELNRNKKQIILSGNNTIENPTNATIEQKVDRKEKRKNSFTLEIRKSESFKVGTHVDMSFEISGMIFNMLGVKASESRIIEGEFETKTEERNKGTITNEVTYHIQHKIIVPAYTSVQVTAIADKIDVVVPFRAKIRITGKADRLRKSGKVIEMTDIDANAVKYYLQRENAKNVFMDANFYFMNTNGTMEIDGYGFNSEIKTKDFASLQHNNTGPPSNKSESSPINSGSSPKNLVLLYQVIFTLLQIIMLLQN